MAKARKGVIQSIKQWRKKRKAERAEVKAQVGFSEKENREATNRKKEFEEGKITGKQEKIKNKREKATQKRAKKAQKKYTPTANKTKLEVDAKIRALQKKLRDFSNKIQTENVQERANAVAVANLGIGSEEAPIENLAKAQRLQVRLGKTSLSGLNTTTKFHVYRYRKKIKSELQKIEKKIQNQTIKGDSIKDLNNELLQLEKRSNALIDVLQERVPEDKNSYFQATLMMVKGEQVAEKSKKLKARRRLNLKNSKLKNATLMSAQQKKATKGYLKGLEKECGDAAKTGREALRFTNPTDDVNLDSLQFIKFITAARRVHAMDAEVRKLPEEDISFFGGEGIVEDGVATEQLWRKLYHTQFLNSLDQKNERKYLTAQEGTSDVRDDSTVGTRKRIQKKIGVIEDKNLQENLEKLLNQTDINYECTSTGKDEVAKQITLFQDCTKNIAELEKLIQGEGTRSDWVRQGAFSDLRARVEGLSESDPAIQKFAKEILKEVADKMQSLEQVQNARKEFSAQLGFLEGLEEGATLIEDSNDTSSARVQATVSLLKAVQTGEVEQARAENKSQVSLAAEEVDFTLYPQQFPIKFIQEKMNEAKQALQNFNKEHPFGVEGEGRELGTELIGLKDNFKNLKALYDIKKAVQDLESDEQLLEKAKGEGRNAEWQKKMKKQIQEKKEAITALLESAKDLDDVRSYTSLLDQQDPIEVLKNTIRLGDQEYAKAVEKVDQEKQGVQELAGTRISLEETINSVSVFYSATKGKIASLQPGKKEKANQRLEQQVTKMLEDAAKGKPVDGSKWEKYEKAVLNPSVGDKLKGLFIKNPSSSKTLQPKKTKAQQNVERRKGEIEEAKTKIVEILDTICGDKDFNYKKAKFSAIKKQYLEKYEQVLDKVGDDDKKLGKVKKQVQADAGAVKKAYEAYKKKKDSKGDSIEIRSELKEKIRKALTRDNFIQKNKSRFL